MLGGRGQLALMSSPRIERLSVDSEPDFPRALLAEGDAAHQHTVAELLPAGFARYLRVFHPFLPADPEDPDEMMPNPARSWASLAEEAGVVFHPELTGSSLLDVLGGSDGPRPYWVSEGRLDEPARTALFRLLAQRGERDAYFLYYLGALVRGSSPLLYRASVTLYREVQYAANQDLGGVDELQPGPEFVWPADRSWVVNTDYDLSATYVACNEGLADAILADPTLEALPVSLDTRVDESADRINDV
jgi:hypothetical protein